MFSDAVCTMLSYLGYYVNGISWLYQWSEKEKNYDMKKKIFTVYWILSDEMSTMRLLYLDSPINIWRSRKFKYFQKQTMEI